jgi:hypothetical protein
MLSTDLKQNFGDRNDLIFVFDSKRIVKHKAEKTGDGYCKYKRVEAEL